MLDRRQMLALGGAAALATFAGGDAFAAKAKPIKVAAIYTVPVEQQWVSRIHKALKAAEARGDITYKFSENVANTDYERVMRQYSQEGADLVVGEVFAVERPGPQGGGRLSQDRLSDGLVLRPDQAELLGVRQLHPRAVLPDRHGGG